MIDNVLIDEFKKEVANICILLQIDVTDTTGTTTTKYYTTLDVPFVDKTNYITYEPLAFSINSFSYSADLSIDNVQLTIDNVKLNQSALQLNKDQRGNNVSIGLAVFDQQGNLLASFELFTGKIASIEIDNKTAVYTIKHELLYWNNSTLRIHTLDLFPNQSDIKTYQTLLWGKKDK